MPKKLKAHILNYGRFLLFYVVVAFLLGVAQQFQVIEHYHLIEFAMAFVYFSVSSWFGWRFYTGMFRDGDFHLDD